MKKKKEILGSYFNGVILFFSGGEDCQHLQKRVGERRGEREPVLPGGGSPRAHRHLERPEM